MRVVALVPGGIDDQLLFFPTLDDLKRYKSDIQIDVVVEPKSKAAYRVSKSVNQVIGFDFKDRNSLADWGNLIGTIRDREYDVAITVGQSWLMGFALWLTGIPIRIGYKGQGSFLTNSVPYKAEQYRANMYHDLLQGLAINSPAGELTINVPKTDIDWAEKEQQRLGVKEAGYVLIYGGSSSKAGTKDISEKVYPLANWKQIVKEFQNKQPDLAILAIEEPENEGFANSFKEIFPNIKITFPEDAGKLAAMISGANLILCTSSASMQLAIAVQTYTIGLFGSTEPMKLMPKSEKFLPIQSSTGKLVDISPQTVMQKVWGG
jgi:ADP-heptose:LPS heptosyltransferase